MWCRSEGLLVEDNDHDHLIVFNCVTPEPTGPPRPFNTTSSVMIPRRVFEMKEELRTKQPSEGPDEDAFDSTGRWSRFQSPSNISNRLSEKHSTDPRLEDGPVPKRQCPIQVERNRKPSSSFAVVPNIQLSQNIRISPTPLPLEQRELTARRGHFYWELVSPAPEPVPLDDVESAARTPVGGTEGLNHGPVDRVRGIQNTAAPSPQQLSNAYLESNSEKAPMLMCGKRPYTEWTGYWGRWTLPALYPQFISQIITLFLTLFFREHTSQSAWSRRIVSRRI